MREALASLARRALRGALLAEARCPGCGRVLPTGSDSSAALCADCLAAMLSVQGAPCPGCGECPPVALTEPVLCGRCREKPRPWGRALVYGPYVGPLKDMILGYKFEARLDFGRRLQECALAAFERGLEMHPELSGLDLLVPVPLHPRRLLARGFNQSLELSRLVSARHGLATEQAALLRVRRTTPQMELSRLARAENIRGAFAAQRRLLEGKAALLVDDIMTTGATLEECARAMQEAGAARVDVLVLARA